MIFQHFRPFTGICRCLIIDTVPECLGCGAEFVLLSSETDAGMLECSACSPSVDQKGMNAGNATILYIDDDPDDLMIFAETLEKQFPQYDVLQAQSGEEGLKKMRDLVEMPCLVILDLNMPKIDGRQVLRSIRQNPQWAQVPVVVFTISASGADLAFGRNLNASFVTKPMNYYTLKETVKTLVSFCA